MERRQHYRVVGGHLTTYASPHSIREIEDTLNGYAAKGYRVIQVFSGRWFLLEWDPYNDREQIDAISGLKDADLKVYEEGLENLQRFVPK